MMESSRFPALHVSAETKYVCTYFRCQWQGTGVEVLRAPHPFSQGDTVLGCPKCLDVESLSFACERAGCWEKARCGQPTADGGYERVCGDHFDTGPQPPGVPKDSSKA